MESKRALSITLRHYCTEKQMIIFKNKYWLSEKASQRNTSIVWFHSYVESNNCWFDKKRKLWFGPNDNQVVPEAIKFSLHTIICLISKINQYLWGNKATKSAYLSCPTCLKFNLGKPVCTSHWYFTLPNGPVKFWQVDFIQIPPFHGYKYALVMVCVFSHWTRAFLCRQATASFVANVR